MKQSLEERVTELERQLAVLMSQVDRHIELTSQIADNFVLLGNALGVPIKKGDLLNEKE